MKTIRAMTRLALGAGLICAAAPAAVHAVSGFANLSGCDSADVRGWATLVERPSDEGVKLVDVTLVMTGMTDGRHAVHIHEVASCSPCGDAKGHFDPGPAGASSPDGNHPFHAGDLVNIEIRDGYGVMATTTSRITLSDGPLGLFDADGSAFIVHVAADSYCPDGEKKGCAGGARAACGVIRRN